VTLREYEAMLILPPEADEATVSSAVDRIGRVVSAGGGSVGDIQRWGRRRLAYELNHLHEAYYVVVRFTAEPGAQGELERTLKLADEVIRAKVMLLPEKRKEKSASPAPV
jgi:small subunit ribosomal protein S6